MKPFGRVMMFIGFGLLTAAVAVYAQETQSTARALDSRQAATAVAKIKLTRVETGEREATSDGESDYPFALLLPRHYELKAENDGFETQNQTDVAVETGGPSARNMTLDIESSTQTVDMGASLALLQTEVSAVAEALDNASITNLSLIDRRSAQSQRPNNSAEQTNSGARSYPAIACGRTNNAEHSIDGGTAGAEKPEAQPLTEPPCIN
jgi:hypothetical protein